MRNIPAIAMIAALSACGSGGGNQTATQQPAQQQIAVRSPEQDMLHKLDDMNRNIGLKRAIRDSGLRCRRVLKSGYVQEYNRLSLWTASCDDGRNWAIFVGPDGSAQVRSCADLNQLKLPGCRISPDPGAAKRTRA